MNDTKNTSQNPDDHKKTQQDGESAAAECPACGKQPASHRPTDCPDCSEGDFTCKCCGISVASDEWCEDDQMCGECAMTQPESTQDA